MTRLGLVFGVLLMVMAVRLFLEAPPEGSPILGAAFAFGGLTFLLAAWEIGGTLRQRDPPPSDKPPAEDHPEAPEPPSAADVAGLIVAGIVIFFILGLLVALFGT